MSERREETVPAYSSWNPDATLSSLPPNEVSDAVNLRMMKPGEYEKRTGYTIFDNIDIGGAFQIVCKCEYTYTAYDGSSTDFDFLFVIVGGELKVRAVNRSPIPGTTEWPLANTAAWIQDDTGNDLVIVSGLNAFEKCYAVQYSSYCMVTVYGYGTFGFYPKAQGSPVWGDPDEWVLEAAGHGVSCVPWQLNAASETTGDLLIIKNDMTVDQNPGPQGTPGIHLSFHYTPQKLTGVPDNYLLPPLDFYRLPCGANYYLSSDSDFNDTDVLFFQKHPKDPATGTGVGSQPARAFSHLETRAWGVIFRIKRKITDAFGQEKIIYSEPSADIWLRNNFYSPPQVLRKAPSASLWTREQQFRSGDGSGLTAPASPPENEVFKFMSYPYNATTPDTRTLKAVPSSAAMETLGTKIIKYYGYNYQYGVDYTAPCVGLVDANNNGTPAGFDFEDRLPLLYWIGYRRVYGISTLRWQQEINFDGDYDCPYFPYVDAFTLARAPLYEYRWTDFSTTDGTTPNPLFPDDADEIEIFRTAFNENTGEVELDGSTQPLFQPNLYGYVGSITRDGTFVDDVPDEEIDFGTQPFDDQSYLQGQFSGQVMREYQYKVVLLNLKTLYKVLPPAGILGGENPPNEPGNSYIMPQAFFYPRVPLEAAANDAYDQPDLITSAGDGLKKVHFYLSYVDSNGIESELTRVNLQLPLGQASGMKQSVVFKIPQGPTPSITKVRIYAAVLENTFGLFGIASGITPRTYYHIADVDPATGYYISNGDETPISSMTTYPQGSGSTVTNAPGNILSSDPNDPFTWQPINEETIRATDEGTALNVILGQLRVLLKRSNDLTNNTPQAPRGEEENNLVGCIGRFLSVLVDDVVFFLSASGMYFLTSQGVNKWPARCEADLLTYLNEEISGQPPLANASRAALGLNNNRKELWLYMPSSVDLGGTLPAKLYIFRIFGGSPANVVDYQFELTEDGNIPDDLTNPPNQAIVFQSHPDGSLWASYRLGDEVRTINVDTSEVFKGDTYIERYYTMGLPLTAKVIERLYTVGDYKGCLLSVMHGCPNPTGVRDPIKGMVYPTAAEHYLNIPPEGIHVRVPWVPQSRVIGQNSTVETTGYTIVVRYRTQFNPDSEDTYNVKHRAQKVVYHLIHENL